MRWKVSAVLLVLFGGASVPAFADVLYDIKSYYGSTPYEYSFTEPAILTTTTIIPGAALNTITAAPCAFTSASITNPFSSSPISRVNVGPGCGGASSLGILGFQTPWNQLGIYGNGGTPMSYVTISALSATTAEPSSLVLLGTGIAGLGSALRRRFRQRN